MNIMSEQVAVGHTVEFVGENPTILQGQVGEVLATVSGCAKVRFNYKEIFTWESWFLIDNLRQRK